MLDERLEGHAVDLGTGVELAEAGLDHAGRRRRTPGRRAEPSPGPGGTGWRTAPRPRARGCGRGVPPGGRTAPDRGPTVPRTCVARRWSIRRWTPIRRGARARVGWACRALAQTRHRIGRTFCTAVPRRHATASRVGAVPGCARLTIRAATDPRDDAIAAAASAHGIDLPGPVVVSDVVLLDADLDDTDRERLGAFLADPLLQTATWDDPPRDDPPTRSPCTPASPTPPPARVVRAAGQLGIGVRAAAGARRIELPPGLPADAVDTLLRRVLANPVIERWAPSTIEPRFSPAASDGRPRPRSVPVRDLDAAGLGALERGAGVALDPAELVAIQRPLPRRGPRPDRRRAGDARPDVERALRPQDVPGPRSRLTTASRSRRCSRQLRDATDADRRAVRARRRSSATPASCRSPTARRSPLKAETHNHPSAIEPFGGANTGVGGVIRDVLGAGHRPIAVTDVLCFGPPDLPTGRRARRRRSTRGASARASSPASPTTATRSGSRRSPARCSTTRLHRQPARVLRLHRHRRRRAGTDRARTPATASSCSAAAPAATASAAPRSPALTMDATTGEVAGASVQIGDPITEKLLIDVLADAGGLYTAITDCGAGGLSSAVGEMAERVGADVDLDRVPLKYPGLAPWEIWLTEAQERMVVAVAPDRPRRARRARATATASRSPTLGVVHRRRRARRAPRRRRRARPRHRVPARRPAAARDDAPTLPAPDRDGRPAADVDDPAATLLALLAHPNIASKASRRSTATTTRSAAPPSCARSSAPATDGHADGVVLADPARRPTASPSASASTRGTALHDPERDGPRRRRRGDPQRRRRRRRPRPRRAARQLLVGRPAPAVDARRAGRRRRTAAATRRSPTARRSCRGKDSLNNEYTRRRRRSATPCRRRW